MPRRSKDGPKIRAATRAVKALAHEHTDYLQHSGHTHSLHQHAANLADLYWIAHLLETGKFQKAHDLATKMHNNRIWYGLANSPKVQIPQAFWELFEE